jgi:purine-binding chemotaxis protein CheW
MGNGPMQDEADGGLERARNRGQHGRSGDGVATGSGWGESLSQPDRDANLILLCRVGSSVCALPIEHVSETMRPLPVEPFAGSPTFVLGLSIIRGSPVPVVDAGRLLGAAEQPRLTRFVTIKVGERRAALAVGAVVGVWSLAATSLDELPPLLREASGDVVAAIGRLDADLLLVLRSARIVPESVWTALEAGEDRP